MSHNYGHNEMERVESGHRRIQDRCGEAVAQRGRPASEVTKRLGQHSQLVCLDQAVRPARGRAQGRRCAV